METITLDKKIKPWLLVSKDDLRTCIRVCNLAYRGGRWEIQSTNGHMLGCFPIEASEGLDTEVTYRIDPVRLKAATKGLPKRQDTYTVQVEDMAPEGDKLDFPDFGQVIPTKFGCLASFGVNADYLKLAQDAMGVDRVKIECGKDALAPMRVTPITNRTGNPFCIIMPRRV